MDATGAAHVTRFTLSTDFPLNLAFQAANAGNADAFITKLDASGSQWLFSTFLGGSSTDFGTGVAVDRQGSI